MFFNSIEFGVFLPIVFACYWLLKKKPVSYQNLFILLASYYFYACWDWRFLILIVISTLVDFYVGQKLATQTNTKQRKLFLGLSIFCNIGMLGFFKYFNFFLEGLEDTFSLFGNDLNFEHYDIILPVGISFYTFQTLSYTIDIYRSKIAPTKNFIAFAAFVTYFPQLVAGPVERAKNLLPQFISKRVFDYHQAADGMRQILWGLFKKMVIADNCATYVDHIFADYDTLSGSNLLLGAVLFGIQIYGDFSGYSDIAIGSARLFGFDLKQNFAFPYFSRNIAEFWRRWHISITTWFRDYIYIPLGGSKEGLRKQLINTFIVFAVSGFWHGANWTFIAWGIINALFFVPLIFANRNRNYLDAVAANRLLPKLKELVQMTVTFTLVSLTWIFFRAENISLAIAYYQSMFSFSFFKIPSMLSFKHLLLILFCFIVEWIARQQKHGLEQLFMKTKRSIRWSFYMLLIFIIYFTGNFSEKIEFIYFQF